ncbi:type 4a pilus biogenesis protein PilO [Actinotalea sp. K2]|uniref:type 4a pilus biogenesis protein PilO n=1 Tax=Actinotalea sp. K2 TaxID=2939438 RepID=UPI002017D54D|nr:type 4a pilus biogenesis protein PilO [Actinotalea sp. K2]MCL3862843.1 type 4a pilus biogenesis protein PilO [Actinotalea sp. K2]
MGTAKASRWIAGTVVVALLIVAGVWFLAVTPKLTEAQETRDITESELARQDILQLQLATLKKQYEDLDSYKAQLEAIQVQFPQDADLADYLREIDAAAAAHGVTIVGLTPGLPQLVVPPVSVAPVPAAEEADAEEVPAEEADDITRDPTQDAAPEPVAEATRLVGIPMSITLVGPYANVSAFLEALQEGTRRLYLVTSLNTSALPLAEASGGRPATQAGDLDMTIDGMIYVLPAVDVPAVDGEEPEVELAPLPASERNPFAPVVGS